MYPSWIGCVIIVVGVFLLLRGSAVHMLMFQMTCSLMAGSAALFLPALGGSSLPPAYLSLVFLVARLLLPGANRGPDFVAAVRPNIFLVIFALYGVSTALILPRIFENAINIVPLRAGKLDFLLQTFPLAPTSQNVTTSVYILGAMLAGLSATAIASSPNLPRTLARWGAVIAGIHVYLGFSGMLLDGTPYSNFLNAFRNGTYAQLDNSFDGVARMNGILPEASAYAGIAFTWFVFHFECWIRDVESRWTGPAAAGLAAALVFSTSSTAYVGLAAYALVMGARMLIFPGTISLDKLVRVAAFAWLIFTAAVVVMALSPRLAARFGNMISHFTVDKADSKSGMQRAFWARQGFEAFLVSKGLGIGAGSFRSSSIVTAILGSMGVVGIVTYFCHVVAMFKPLRRSTFVPPQDDRAKVGAVASWTALFMLVPAGIGAASPNPGADFAMFAGMALALRAAPAAATALRRFRDREISRPPPFYAPPAPRAALE